MEGFTGEKIVKEIARNPPFAGVELVISGRDPVKLQKLADEIAPFKVTICRISLDDQNGLKDTIALAKVCINCVGPFRLYGAPVVKACVEGRTNYVDICGETEVIEQMYADYNLTAIENNIALIPACGYDSLPADVGCLHNKLELQKGGCIPSTVEMFVNMYHGPSGVTVNATTFISAVLGFDSVKNLRALRKKTHRKVNTIGRTLHVYRNPRWDPRVSSYTVPAAVADVPVVKLGQQMIENHHDYYKNGHKFGKYTPPSVPAVQFAGYFGLQSIVSVAYVSYLGLLFGAMAYLPFLKNWYIKYPEFFTLGVFKKSGPSAQQLSESSFGQTFIGRGYKNLDDFSKPQNYEVVTSIRGPEMGYVATPICVTASAYLLISEDREKIPNGVLTPAVAFSNVFDRLVKQLNERGVKFSVNSCRDL
ncbi:hypothetical protein HDV02_006358 [Globomyces sp. JEL0801]|nr:hypothetical protein HDV02_006358 [Globomyces sp. JEL0801]